MTAGYGTTNENSVEIFVPSTGQHCRLPTLTGFGRRWYDHITEKLTVCGQPYGSHKACLTLINGTWEQTATTIKRRYELIIFIIFNINDQMGTRKLALTIRINPYGTGQNQ